MKIIAFSKDRPMQLQATLESFKFCTNVNYEYDSLKTIIPKETSEYLSVTYEAEHFDTVEEVDYNSFDETLRTSLRGIGGDYVLFLCDDCLYTRFVSFEPALDYLRKNQDVLGFSLRLGTNINYRPPNVSTDSRFYKWGWTNASGHWGYPFEVMSTLYRGALVKEFLDQDKTILRNPNDFEARCSTYCSQTRKQPFMACFNTPSYVVAADINRVQDYYPNKFNGGPEHSAENLLKLYREGKRFDWSGYFNRTPCDPFMGSSHFKLRK